MTFRQVPILSDSRTSSHVLQIVLLIKYEIGIVIQPSTKLAPCYLSSVLLLSVLSCPARLGCGLLVLVCVLSRVVGCVFLVVVSQTDALVVAHLLCRNTRQVFSLPRGVSLSLSGCRGCIRRSFSARVFSIPNLRSMWCRIQSMQDEVAEMHTSAYSRFQLT